MKKYIYTIIAILITLFGTIYLTLDKFEKSNTSIILSKKIYLGVNLFSLTLILIISVFILSIFNKLAYKLLTKENLKNSINISLQIIFTLQFFHMLIDYFGNSISSIGLIFLIVLNPCIHITLFLIWYMHGVEKFKNILLISIPTYIYLVLDLITLIKGGIK